MDIEKRLETAYSKLSLKEPFIAAVMSKVERKICPTTCPTAGTDGKTAWYNPEFIEPLTARELFGLVLHESLHVVLMHMWRRGDRDPSIWNRANDAIINAYILKSGYALPSGGVHIDWVTDDMDSEYVYNKLKQNDDSESNDSEQGDGEEGQADAGGFDGTGDLIDAPTEASVSDIEATIAASARMAKECGHGSSIVDKVLSKLGQSKKDWRTELRAMMTSSSQADYSYRRPSRRFIGQGIYLPSLYSEGLGGILFGIDISGSMTDDELNQINAEITQIADDLQPEFVEVVYCNTDVRSTQRFERGEEVELSCSWGGGTRFKPVFDYLENMEQRPVGMIYFSDLCGDLNECKEPDIPVIWANTSTYKTEVPFGVLTTVEI